ncbi:hypothetical protein ACWCPQ_14480 [Nocardia sp. NPDC001965]
MLYVTTASLLKGLHVLVYRSIHVEDDDDLYRSVVDLVGGAVPLIRAIIPDKRMMGGAGELSTYFLDAEEGPEAVEAA